MNSYLNFNELNQQERSLLEIKQQWRSMKVDAKKQLGAYKKALKSTGGGGRPPSPDETTIKIMEMVPLEFEEGENMFDSDTITQKENQKSNQPEIVIEDINDIDLMTEIDKPVDDTHTPLKSIENVSRNQLKIKKRSTENVSNQKEKKNESAKSHRDTAIIKLMEEEHKLKMQQMKEAHKWAKEIHELKMKKIKLKNMLLEIKLSNC
ncbi:hypothetical protein ABMA27_011427 [Loxostege sticticalis]|uniref:Regulatory protein zeste n=2 Tax=Loxostege sticticalis TaxID=481309 RepID=A0ABR3IG76_LOXSC